MRLLSLFLILLSASGAFASLGEKCTRWNFSADGAFVLVDSGASVDEYGRNSCVDLGHALDRTVDVFGAVRVPPATAPPDEVGFTGHLNDGETGLVYAKARYLEPETGRFLSEDPFRGDIGDPFSTQGFMYAHANPMRFVDPDGRRGMEVAGQELAIVEASTGQIQRGRVRVGMPQSAGRSRGFVGAAASRVGLRLIEQTDPFMKVDRALDASGDSSINPAAHIMVSTAAAYNSDDAVVSGTNVGDVVFDVVSTVTAVKALASIPRLAMGLLKNLKSAPSTVEAPLEVSLKRFRMGPSKHTQGPSSVGAGVNDSVPFAATSEEQIADAVEDAFTHGRVRSEPPFDIGLAREQRVAELTRGGVASRPTAKSGQQFGLVDHDLRGPSGRVVRVDVVSERGDLILVGGAAKAADLSKLGSRIATLREVAAARGVRAQHYFAEGTPQSVLDFAAKRLGKENVVVFSME